MWYNWDTLGREVCHMTLAVPVRETKDTAGFAKTVAEAGGPVIVTKNGREEYVALSMEEYDSLKYNATMSDLYAALLVSERQGAEGKVTGVEELRAELGKRYGV